MSLLFDVVTKQKSLILAPKNEQQKMHKKFGRQLQALTETE
jgi:hypothetical protein